MKSGGMMKNDNRNDRRTSGPAKGTGKTKATGKANAAGKTKVTAGKENRVPVGQGREKTAVKKKSGLCPVADKCGGCSWINKPYVEQLKNKEKQLKELLAPFCKVEGVIPMEHPEHYRNKVHAVFGENRYHDAISGIYEQKSHRIVPVDSCLIENAKADEIIVSIRGLLKSFHIRPYNEDTGYGLLRHVLIRKGFSTGQIMVCLILNGSSFAAEQELADRLFEKVPGMTSFSVNSNTERTNVIMGSKTRTIRGKDRIEDTIGGLVFTISPQSFYQVNPVQTENIYSQALSYAGLTGNETVWDLYCGIGTISLFLARQAKQVYGVEIVPQAIDDARQNAVRNGIDNAKFYVGKAEEVLPHLYETEGIFADVIVVDPPRKGCDEECLNTILKMRPKRLVYVSCDSATLARDLKYLCSQGYELKCGRAFDNFPMGGHVETVIMMTYCGDKGE